MATLQKTSSWKMLETLDGELCLTLTAEPGPGVSKEAARQKLLSHLDEARTTAKIPALFKAE